MIIWQLIQLLILVICVVAVHASDFDLKSKNMKVAASAVEILEHQEEVKITGKEIIPIESMKLVISSSYKETSINEDEQLFAYAELMKIVAFICEEALKREDKKTFANNWLSAVFELTKEVYAKQMYGERDTDSDDDEDFDSATFGEDFDKPMRKRPAYKGGSVDVLFSSDSDSSSIEEVTLTSSDNEVVEKFDDGTDLFDSFKSKMIKEDESEDKEDSGSGKESEYSDCKMDITLEQHEQKENNDNYSDVEGEEKQAIVRESLRVLKDRKGRRGGRIRGALNSNNLNMATNLMMNMAADSKGESNFEVQEEQTINYSNTNANSNALAGIDTAGMMDQMQQQIMAQLMAQLTQNNPQLAQMTSVLQDERGKFEAAMGGGNGDELPEISKEGMVQFLRTSALPKLLNSAIKGKTGIDVLKSLAMALRVLNEGLGIAEVILKMLIRVTKAARYYALVISDVVADMAREDNMKPMVDLSVSLDSIPSMSKKSSGSKMKRLTAMFRKSRKNGSGSGPENEMSPFTMGMHAALSKARDYTVEFQKLPPNLLLTLIHTIFAELDKRNGIIRVALARKQHKTLIGMQDEISKAVEIIYEAIKSKDEEAYNNIHNVSPMMITDILISLISPVKMEPAKIESHISKVTTWIKPLMAIMDQESQLSILKYLLNDPDAEIAFRRSQGITEEQEGKKFVPKKIQFSLTKRYQQQSK